MSKLARSVAIPLIFAVAAAAQSPLQDWNVVKALAPGTDVRVVAARTLRVTVQSATDDSLIVHSGKGLETIARQDIARVSVRKRGHRGRNALIGLAAGAGAGAVIGAATDHTCTGWCIFQVSKGTAAGILAVVFGGVGAAIGAVIPTGGWLEVYRR